MQNEIESLAPRFRSFGYYIYPPFNWKWLFNMMVWYFASAGVAKCAGAIPDINTNSITFKLWFNRELFNTTYFPLSQLIFYLVMIVIGWAYVSTNMRRKDLFISGNGDYKSFF